MQKELGRRENTLKDDFSFSEASPAPFQLFKTSIEISIKFDDLA